MNYSNDVSGNVAIIGIGAIFPDSENTKKYWSMIKCGQSAIREIPETHWNINDYYDKDPKIPDKTYGKTGGFIKPVDFDPMEFGIAPNSLEAIDSSHILSLLAAKAALEDGGYGQGGKNFPKESAGVILGITGAQKLAIELGARLGYPIWKQAVLDAGGDEALADDVVKRIASKYPEWQEQSFPGLLGNVAAGRIANHFDLGGINCAIDAACASSLGAVNMAYTELISHRADMMLTGGADTFSDIFMYMCFSKTPAMSSEGTAKPFSENGDGTCLGEGVGILLLKRYEDALKDGDRIYAVIRGIGAASDGRGAAVFAPQSKGQVKAIERAYAQSGISPYTVDMIEAHGTGTKVGDGIELKSLNAVFGSGEDGKKKCALGSVKAQIGHCKAAAGVAGIIKAALSLYYKLIPPTLISEPALAGLRDKNSRFYLNDKARPWISDNKYPRRAGVSAFGFGGSDFHCVLEEASSRKQEIDWNDDVQIISFSSDSKSEIIKAIRSIEGKSWEEFSKFAFESRQTFDSSKKYLVAAAVSSNNFDFVSLKQRLENAVLEEKSSPFSEGIFFSDRKRSGNIAFLFPGQGSQYVGMMRDSACLFPEFIYSLDLMEKAYSNLHSSKLSDIIYPLPGYESPERKSAVLTETKNAQPALGAVSLASALTLLDLGVVPSAVAGHSYGELAALCFSGKITPEVFAELSVLRGTLMASENASDGAMCAVMSDFESLDKILREENLNLKIANRNAPRQMVLSGDVAGIEKAITVLSKRGIAAKRLKVSAAFHSELIAGAARPFADRVAKVTFYPSDIQAYSNLTAKPYVEGLEHNLLAEHMTNSVLFHDEISNMYNDGVRLFIEVGPGCKISGLVKNILSDKDDFEALSADSSNGRRSSLMDLALLLSRLASLGLPIDLSLWNPVAAKTKKPKFTVKISGANYIKNRDIPASKLKYRDVRFYEKVLSEKRISDDKISKDISNAASQFVSSKENSLAKAIEAMYLQTAELHRQFLENQRIVLDSLRVALNISGNAPVSSAAKAEPHVPRSESEQRLPSVSIIESDTSETANYKSETGFLNILPSSESKRRSSNADNSSGDSSLFGVLVKVISDKTGYPSEMLSAEMDLESDLGIDSIKKVEIFSSLKDLLPGMPSVSASDMGSIRTVGEAVSFIRGGISDFSASDDSSENSRAGISFPETSDYSTLSMMKLSLDLKGESKIRNFAGVHIVSDKGKSASIIKIGFEALGYHPSVGTLDSIPKDIDFLVIAGEEAETDVSFIERAFCVVKEFLKSGGKGLASVSFMDGAFGLTGNIREPNQGGLAGLIKTAALEFPSVFMRAIDFDPDLMGNKSKLKTLAYELLAEGPIEVAVSKDGVKSLNISKTHMPNLSVPKDLFASGDVIIATGGGRGVTAFCLCELLKALPEGKRPSVVLVGRTDILKEEPEYTKQIDSEIEIRRVLTRYEPASRPAETGGKAREILASREIKKTMSSIRKTGVKCSYVRADVRNVDYLDKITKEAERLGSVVGFIHGAGIIKDKLLADKTLDEFSSVLRTKVDGAEQLLRILGQKELKLIAFFSSSTARFGRKGQIDYCAANEILNKLARKEKFTRPDCVVKSFNWGPWDGGMVDAGLKKLFASEGVGVIPLASGARLMADEILFGDEEVEKVVLAKLDTSVEPAFKKELSISEFPVLKDHVIDAKAVMPLALSAELLMEGALAANPGYFFIGYDDMRVHAPIKLEKNQKLLCGVFVSEREKTDGRICLYSELKTLNKSGNWELKVSASIILSSSKPAVKLACLESIAGGEFKGDDLYSGLFHGKALQGIKNVIGFSEKGIELKAVTAPKPAEWILHPKRSGWVSDPLISDCAFQAIILWTLKYNSAPSLPAYVKSFRQYSRISEKEIRIAVFVKSSANNIVVSDIFFKNSKGDLVAEMLGCECVVYENLKKTFLANKL